MGLHFEERPSTAQQDMDGSGKCIIKHCIIPGKDTFNFIMEIFNTASLV